MFRKSSPLVIAGLALGLSGSAFALGLGEIKLHSNLNQPLNAEIRLLSAGSLSKEQIVANLANVKEFKRAGVEHNFFLHQLRFKPIFHDDGTVVIKVTTRQPVKEPFLDFLLEVNWPNGRVMREYTLLLDPPVFSNVEMSSSPEAPTASQPESNDPSSSQEVKIQTIQNDQWEVSTQGNYQIKDADTLWSISRKNRPQSVSIQRTMVAVFEANPEAFINQNMNEMKTGAVLKMPNEAGVNSISQQQALLEIARQNQLWGGRGNAGTRPDVVVDTATYQGTVDGSGQHKDRLKLSVPSNKPVSNEDIMQSEAVATLSDENATLKSRVQQQTEEIEKLKRKLAINSNSLASIQNNDVQNADDTTSVKDAQTATASTNPETKNDAEQTASDKNTDNVVEGGDKIQPTSDVDSAPDSKNEIKTEAKTEVPAAEVKKKTSAAVNTSPPVSPAKEKSFIDSLLSLGLSVWIAIGSGLLVLFFSILWYRRKNMEEESFQESLVVPIDGDIDEDELPEVGDEILAADMDDDFIPESEAIMDEKNPVDVETNADPLGEADVYIAYGKFQQAEKILKDAIEEDPERTDLRLKLMECFAESKTQSEFNEQKRELLEVLATDASVAEKVSIMEKEAWPEESEEDELPSTEDIFGDLSFSSDADESTDEDELVFPEEEVEKEISEGFDVDNETIEYSPTSEHDLTHDEEDDYQEQPNEINELEDEVTDELSDELENTNLDFDDSDLEFNSQNEDKADSDEQNSELSIEDDLEDSEFIDELDDELDAETDDSDADIDESILELGDVDEASTKLDLARAYIDMEDYDGANEILREVIAEGNDDQKKEAEDLLSQMN